jgi:CHAT domain-containing protein
VLFDDAHESELNFPVKQRRTTIAHFYIDYLSRRSHRQDSSLDVNTLDTTFLLVQKLQKSTLIKASNATMARSAAAYDEKLFNLVRKEQDLGIQMKGIQAALADVISVVDNPRRKALISAHKEELETVRQARTAIQNEIKSRFPRYTNFIHPQPIRIETIQKSLGPEESMLVVYPTKDWTYVWAISKQGPVRFNKVGIKQTELAATVRELRRSLVPESEFIHDWPSFDIQSAFILYEKILKPVEDAWNGKKELFLMVSGALGQLPFSLLPTAPQELSLDGDLLFTEYRKIPWLIRKIALTRIPSVHSLVAARQQQSIVRPERQFAGFGDPLFSPNAVATADQQRETSQVASRGGRLKLRGIRVTAKGNLDDSSINSIQMSKLIRLPDTADEIKAIAEILNADFHSDIFLDANASEGRVKSLDLSNRRNIVFASHGLLPGDLDGLYEPAIALSSPLVTKEDEDGLLTMSEVLTLKLNADWVVLSACNTGAGDGKGTEAVTGLGQAFIYAGSRALLVSMWPVETTSAQKITTGLFQYQKENPAASKGQALQQVMLDLLDRQELRDQETGQIQASYAHPLFWAPFIVFGEGGI